MSLLTRFFMCCAAFFCLFFQKWLSAQKQAIQEDLHRFWTKQVQERKVLRCRNDTSARVHVRHVFVLVGETLHALR
jgi:hypothetical protein